MEEFMAHKEIDQALAEACAAKQVAGVVAAAASDNGVVYEGAFGRRDLGRADAMTVDTVFWIASMTKAVTGAAAMQLVEQGKLALDQPIGRLLPQLAEPKVLEGFDAAGKPRLRPAKRPITLKHLLTHTAGFSYDIWNTNIGKYMEAAGIPGVITCQNAALTTPLTFDPGERWDYGINIDWVGKAVEQVSGKDLNVYLREHLFAPLGMRDTGFHLGDSQRRRLVGMHARGADGQLQPIPFAMPEAPEFYMGGGGLYSTAHDYLIFLRMLLGRGRHGGAQVLKPETVALMAQNHIGEIEVGWLRSAAPAFSNDANFFPDQPQKWGLSFLINTRTTAEGRRAGSLAWAGLGNTYFWCDPARRVCGVILFQMLPFADTKCLELFRGFERGIYRAIAA
jgi:CubicO group peptidase (beta-lactamase class C family)